MFDKLLKLIIDNAIIDDLGWRSCYTCTECIEDWLEETGQTGGDE